MAYRIDDIALSSAQFDVRHGFDLGVSLRVGLLDGLIKQLFAIDPDLFKGEKTVETPAARLDWRLTRPPTLSLAASDVLEAELVRTWQSQRGVGRMDPAIQEALHGAAQAGLQITDGQLRLDIAVAGVAPFSCSLAFEAKALLALTDAPALVVTPLAAQVDAADAEALRRQLKSVFQNTDDPVRDLLFDLINDVAIPLALDRLRDRLVLPIPDLTWQGLQLSQPRLATDPKSGRIHVLARAIPSRPSHGWSNALHAPPGDFPDRDAAVVASAGFLRLAAASALEARREFTVLDTSGHFGPLGYQLTSTARVDDLKLLLRDSGASDGAVIDGDAAVEVFGEVVLRTGHLAFSLDFHTDVIRGLTFEASLAIDEAQGQVLLKVSPRFVTPLQISWRGLHEKMADWVENLQGVLRNLENRILAELKDRLSALSFSKVVMETLPLIPLKEIGGVTYEAALSGLTVATHPETLSLGLDLALQPHMPADPALRYEREVKVGRSSFTAYRIGPKAPDDKAWSLSAEQPGFAFPRNGDVGVFRYWICTKGGKGGESVPKGRGYHSVEEPRQPLFPGLQGDEWLWLEKRQAGDRSGPELDFEYAFGGFRQARPGTIPVHQVYRHPTRGKSGPIVTDLVPADQLAKRVKAKWIDGGVLFHAMPRA